MKENRSTTSQKIMHPDIFKIGFYLYIYLKKMYNQDSLKALRCLMTYPLGVSFNLSQVVFYHARCHTPKIPLNFLQECTVLSPNLANLIHSFPTKQHTRGRDKISELDLQF